MTALPGQSEHFSPAESRPQTFSAGGKARSTRAQEFKKKSSGYRGSTFIDQTAIAKIVLSELRDAVNGKVAAAEHERSASPRHEGELQEVHGLLARAT